MPAVHHGRAQDRYSVVSRIGRDKSRSVDPSHWASLDPTSVARSALARTYSRRAANACRSTASGVHVCPILGKRGHSLLLVASGSESCLPSRGASSEGWPGAPVFSCRVLRRRVTISLTSFLFTLIVGGPKMAASSSAPRKTTTQQRRRLQLFAKQTARPTFRTGLNGVLRWRWLDFWRLSQWR